MISPFATTPQPPAWNELGEYQAILQRIAKTPNLRQLVSAFGFKAYQYTFLCQQGLIIDSEVELNLTDVSKGYLDRYCSQRFEGGDLATILRMVPRLGRMADTRGCWIGYTDEEYVLRIYSEDMHMIEKAGYPVPGWNDRSEFICDISVVVSREIQSSGWRIASVEKREQS